MNLNSQSHILNNSSLKPLVQNKLVSVKNSRPIKTIAISSLVDCEVMLVSWFLIKKELMDFNKSGELNVIYIILTKKKNSFRFENKA